MKVWHKRIQDAHTWQELLQAARDYIATLTPHEWASIPGNARPDRIKGIDDIAFWHRRLEDEFLSVAARTDVSDTFRHVVGFFRAAAERADEMHGAATPPDHAAENDVDAAAPKRDARSRAD
jgi:hypothetical protein